MYFRVIILIPLYLVIIKMITSDLESPEGMLIRVQKCCRIVNLLYNSIYYFVDIIYTLKYSFELDLGELCTPYRYSFPPGCINTVILKELEKKGNISGDSASNGTTLELLQNLSDVSNKTKDEDDLNINSSNLTKPFCIYR
jgi:hypothetical protein